MKNLLIIEVVFLLGVQVDLRAQNKCGERQQTDCLKGLDFRVKKGDFK